MSGVDGAKTALRYGPQAGLVVRLVKVSELAPAVTLMSMADTVEVPVSKAKVRVRDSTTPLSAEAACQSVERLALRRLYHAAR